VTYCFELRPALQMNYKSRSLDSSLDLNNQEQNTSTKKEVIRRKKR